MAGRGRGRLRVREPARASPRDGGILVAALLTVSTEETRRREASPRLGREGELFTSETGPLMLERTLEISGPAGGL